METFSNLLTFVNLFSKKKGGTAMAPPILIPAPVWAQRKSRKKRKSRI